MNQSKKITDGALLTAVFMVLLLATIFVPYLAIIGLFLLPVPFVFFAYKYDWQPATIMLIATILLSSLFFTVLSLPLTILVGVSGVLLGTAIHHNLHAYETWARGTLGFVIGLAFIYLYTQLFLQINWSAEFDQLLKESMATSKQMMEAMGIEQTEEELEIAKSFMMQMKDLLPVGIVFVSAILAIISQWISYKVINRLENKQFQFPPFRTFKLPVAIVWIYFIAILLTFFELDPNSILYLGVQNVHVLVGLLIALQGFSFLFFYAYEKKKSNVLPVIGVVVTVLFPFLFLYLIRIIGIIDIGFSLRDRIATGKK